MYNRDRANTVKCEIKFWLRLKRSQQLAPRSPERQREREWKSNSWHVFYLSKKRGYWTNCTRTRIFFYFYTQRERITASSSLAHSSERAKFHLLFWKIWCDSVWGICSRSFARICAHISLSMVFFFLNNDNRIFVVEFMRWQENHIDSGTLVVEFLAVNEYTTITSFT